MVVNKIRIRRSKLNSTSDKFGMAIFLQVKVSSSVKFRVNLLNLVWDDFISDSKRQNKETDTPFQAREIVTVLKS